MAVDRHQGDGSNESQVEPTRENSVVAPRDCGALNRCESQYTVSTLPTPTITDLASFAPTPTTLTSTPEHFALAGLPLTLHAPTTQHTATGTLFNLPVTVRFTPTTTTIDTGDGTRLTAPTPHPTTHTYTQRGTHTATATTHYTAHIDYGTGWIPIPGTLTIPTTPYTITVLEARTALVQHTCTQNPHATGC